MAVAPEQVAEFQDSGVAFRLHQAITAPEKQLFKPPTVIIPVNKLELVSSASGDSRVHVVGHTIVSVAPRQPIEANNSYQYTEEMQSLLSDKLSFLPPGKANGFQLFTGFWRKNFGCHGVSTGEILYREVAKNFEQDPRLPKVVDTRIIPFPTPDLAVSFVQYLKQCDRPQSAGRFQFPDYVEEFFDKTKKQQIMPFSLVQKAAKYYPFIFPIRYAH